MSAHDRFESLAGAVALGEASPQERAAFDVHASTCEVCRDDAASGAFVVARVADAHRSETWRPSQPIVERIRSRRSGRARFTLGALGWAVAGSLVLNVALAGGLGARLAGAFQSQPAAPAQVASSAITLDAPHVLVVAPRAWRAARSTVAVAPEHAHAVARKAYVAKAYAKSKVPKIPTLDDVPDLLAGLDLYGTGSIGHHVAVVPAPLCRKRTPLDAEVAGDARPCRMPNAPIDY